MNKHSLHIRELCMIGLFTAIIAIMAQIVIPTPFGVPMTMQTFAITLAGLILGAKNGAIASIIYVLVGAIGVPVFAGFTGGWQSIVGPTGGFILSFPIMAYIIGLGMDYRSKWKFAPILALAFGTVLNLFVGCVYFTHVTKVSLFASFMTTIVPFLLPTLLKAILAYPLGINIRRRLQAFF